MPQPKSVVMILREFFGYKEGQTLKEFGEEIKQLSETEKMELATLAAEKLGYEIEKK